MMAEPAIDIPLSCDEAVERISHAFQAAGYQVERSFDLQSARQALRVPESCPCPHHGTAQCSCQYVVLLVSLDGPPVSLSAHGQEHHTVLAFEGSAAGHPAVKHLRELAKSLAPAS